MTLFLFKKRKPVLKEKPISLVKLSFLKKGLRSHTSCLEGEGSKDKAKSKMKNAKF
jgi:hypothetical protein